MLTERQEIDLILLIQTQCPSYERGVTLVSVGPEKSGQRKWFSISTPFIVWHHHHIYSYNYYISIEENPNDCVISSEYILQSLIKKIHHTLFRWLCIYTLDWRIQSFWLVMYIYGRLKNTVCQREYINTI